MLIRFLIELDTHDVVDSVETFTVPAAGGVNIPEYSLTNGRILSISLHTSTGTAPIGTVFAVIYIRHGKPDTGANRLPITSGVVAFQNPLLYPGSVPSSAIEKPAENTTLEIANPGAGLGFSYAPTGIAYPELVAGSFNFIAAAAAANRTIVAEFTSSGNIIARVTTRTNIIISETRRIVLWSGPNMPADDTANHYLPIPRNQSYKNWQLAVTANNIDAGDEFQGIFIVTRQQITNL